MALEQAIQALRPVLYLGLSGLAFAISLHAPKHGQRLALLPLILTPAFLSLSAALHVPFAPGVSLVWAQALTGYILHTISTLHLEGISPPCPSVPGSPTPGSSTFFNFDFGYFRRIWLNPRLIRTHSTQAAQERPKQSRGVFLVLQLSKLLTYYIIQTKISPALYDEVVIDILPDDVAPYQQSLWRPLNGFTARECLNVTFVTFSSFWTTFVYLDGTNALMGALFVMIGLDDPEDWPPLFGRLSQAVGLRNFWSRFWHTLPMKPYRSIGGYVSLRIVRCSPRSFAHKSIIALVAFGLSGAAHALIDWQRGSPDWHLNIYWFLLNFIGCMGESLFVKMLRQLARRAGREHDLRTLEESWLGSFVGYVWVCVFFCWTVPMWRFPEIHRQSLAFQSMRQLLSNMQIVQQ
ncbi:hypothetical protein N7530_010225 [Penicillium desertorum]|uniref:Wax synthase domain-containing protein n=1 Tax=Penicillium desertorum TaxID=1303715 RepID=A0A9X0BIX2_9EURO|nr:hypothetical protein N7530_010225 [Penicillium desertorum]